MITESRLRRLIRALDRFLEDLYADDEQILLIAYAEGAKKALEKYRDG